MNKCNRKEIEEQDSKDMTIFNSRIEEDMRYIEEQDSGRNKRKKMVDWNWKEENEQMQRGTVWFPSNYTW